MKRYRSLGGDSGVMRYEIGPDYIRVQFEGGRGLSGYISRHVQTAYARKER